MLVKFARILQYPVLWVDVFTGLAIGFLLSLFAIFPVVQGSGIGYLIFLALALPFLGLVSIVLTFLILKRTAGDKKNNTGLVWGKYHLLLYVPVLFLGRYVFIPLMELLPLAADLFLN